MKEYKCHREWRSIRGDVNARNIVYTLTHTSGRVYVGRTTRGFRERYFSALKIACTALKHYDKREFDVEIEECLDEQDMKEREVELIKQVVDKNKLLNDTFNYVVGPLEGMKLVDVEPGEARKIDEMIEEAFRLGLSFET